MANKAKCEARELLLEIEKLNPEKDKEKRVDSEVWEEICQLTKDIINNFCPGVSIGEDDRFLTPPTPYEAYKISNAEIAGQIWERADTRVANRKKYAPYGNMEAEELVRAWCSRPEIRIEFDSNFQWFVNCIIETFPDSPGQEFASHKYLKEFSQENLDRMIQDRQQKQASEPQKGEKAKSQPEKLSAKAKVLAALIEHPDWSNTKIAKEAGINRTTLYNYPEFKTARKVQKQNKGKIPRGSKYQDGTIEAFDE